MKTNEIWKDAFGYEGILSVSNLGNVKRMPFINKISYKNPRLFKGGIIKLNQMGKGYLTNKGYLSFRLNNKNLKVHRLVANTFINNPDNKKQVNHIDGNTLNNNVSNLEWCDNFENTRHRYLNRELFTSKYIGVYYRFDRKWYGAELQLNKKKYRKYGFKTEEDAYLYLCNLKEEIGIKSKY